MTMSDDEPRQTSPEPRAPRTPVERDEIRTVDDPVTKLFVAAVIVVFVLIFANAFLLGKGGLLTATPSPSPAPTASPTVAPTASPTPSVTVAPTATPTAPPTATPTPTQ